jgi:CubicO group peptidase (beta-lactamase class C family)
MAIMKLVEQGRVRLADPVSLYIPDFKNWQSADGKQKVTIRLHHLLTHSSGLPPYAPVAELQAHSGTNNPGAVISWIAQSRRDFEPGTAFQYNCLNYITLQYIVEQVSGMSLRQFTRQQIFGPLEMDHTDYLPCRLDENGRWVNTDKPCWGSFDDIAPTEQLESGQVLCGQVHDPLARVMMGGISGNAGIFTTADDVAVLCAMLQNGGEWNGRRILSPLTVKAIRSVPREEAATGRTLGWDCSSPYASNNGDLLSPHTYSHTGYTGTSIVIDPDNDVSIILLTNAVHPADKGRTVRLRSCVANAVAAAIVPGHDADAVRQSRHPQGRKN